MVASCGAELLAWIPSCFGRVQAFYQGLSGTTVGITVGAATWGIFSGLQRAYEGMGHPSLRELSARFLPYTPAASLDGVLADLMDQLERGKFETRFVGAKRAHRAESLSGQVRRRLRVVSMNLSEAPVEATAALVNRLAPDLLATQSVSLGHQKFFQNELDDDYSILEMAHGSLLYRHSRFELLRYGHRNLVIEGKRFSLPIVILKDRSNNNLVIHLNVQLHFSQACRRQSQAQEVARIVASLPKGVPVLLTGTLNTFPARMDLDLPAYDGPEVMERLGQAELVDSRAKAVLGQMGPDETAEIYDLPPLTLDRILVNESVEVLSQAHETARLYGKRPLAHLPVVADVLISTSEPDSTDSEQALTDLFCEGSFEEGKPK